MVDRPLDANLVEAATLPSLFDQVPAVYAFCREHLFRDDTDRIAEALWPAARPETGSALLELGCGPGFYSRRLAARFAELQVVGLDRSPAQLERARSRRDAERLGNCRFDLGDATALPYPDASIDAVVSARLLATVDAPTRVVTEAHRVLRPGGRLFIAEPRSSVRAAVPISLMRIAAQLEALRRGRAPGDTDRVRVLDAASFGRLVHAGPWEHARVWSDASYQYALLEKGGVGRARTCERWRGTSARVADARAADARDGRAG